MQLTHYSWYCYLMTASKLEAHEEEKCSCCVCLGSIASQVDSYGNTNSRNNISMKDAEKSLLVSGGLGHCVHIHLISNEICNLNDAPYKSFLTDATGRFWLYHWVGQTVDFLRCFPPTKKHHELLFNCFT